jgi:hypothetical protein
MLAKSAPWHTAYPDSYSTYSRCQLDVISFLTFYVSRVWRSGPRFALQVGVIIATLVYVSGLLPQRLADVTFGQVYSDLVRWSFTPDDGSVGGGIRIVVFGSPDIATPVTLERNGKKAPARKSWTELLCEEVGSTLCYHGRKKEVSCERLLTINRSVARIIYLTSLPVLWTDQSYPTQYIEANTRSY